MAIPKLQGLQHDPAELEKCKKDPAYFYNMYMRQEGEKVLTNDDLKKRGKIGTVTTLLTQIEKSADATTGT